MKKILAVLMILAMVLSVSAVAFADDVAVVKLTATAGTQTRFQFQHKTVALAVNDEVEFLVQLPNITDVATNASAKVGKLTARVYGGGTKYVDAKAFDDTWVEDLGDDWYKITFTVTEASTGMMMAFFYYTEDGTEAKPADGSVINLASIKVNGTAATLDVADFEGKGLTLAAETATVAGPAAGATTEDANTEDVENTEDVTTGTEETGVVSVAVVAVAAVIGGAVVLKKREF